MDLLEIVRMSAFVTDSNTCKRFWDQSVHAVRPRETDAAIYYNTPWELLVVTETQVLNMCAGLWEIVNLLTNYQVSQFFQAHELSILLPYVKERVDPAKKFGPNHVGHSDIDTLHSWSYVVSTSIKLAPETTTMMRDGDIGSLADQSEILYVFIRVQARCDVFINLKMKHMVSDHGLLFIVDGLTEVNVIKGQFTSVGS